MPSCDDSVLTRGMIIEMADTDGALQSPLNAQSFCRSDDGWYHVLTVDGSDGDFELVIPGDERPSLPHLRHAAAFIEKLPQLRPAMEAALAAAPESDPLFPPHHARQWHLESITFWSSVPETVDVAFSLSELAYDYVYVAYHVVLHEDYVVRVYAATR